MTTGKFLVNVGPGVFTVNHPQFTPAESLVIALAISPEIEALVGRVLAKPPRGMYAEIEAVRVLRDGVPEKP